MRVARPCSRFGVGAQFMPCRGRVTRGAFGVVDSTWRLSLSMAVLVSMLPAASLAAGTGQPLSPYSAFQSMTEGQLATLQVKLTYVGSHDEPLSSVLFTSMSNTPNIAAFTPFRRTNVNYSNDDQAAVQSFTATTTQLRAMIDSVGTLPSVTAGGVAAPMLMSFALYNSVNGPQVFEAILNQTQAVALFGELRNALRQNAAGLKQLDAFACVVDAMDPARPTDVTSQVSVSLSGFRLDRKSGLFVSRATVLNTGGSSVAGPVTLVFQYGAPGFRLANGTGTTCALTPTGQDYLNLSVGSLAPGVPVTVKLQFEDVDRLVIHTSVLVFAGPGAR